jgi:hypothetical protein
MWITHNKELFCLTLDDPLHVKNILCNKTTTSSKHHRESALMTAVHILICLTKGKSREEIARDFDDNLELVRVWIDYMIAINWVYKNAADGTWVVSDNGKMWIEKYYTM